MDWLKADFVIKIFILGACFGMLCAAAIYKVLTKYYK